MGNFSTYFSRRGLKLEESQTEHKTERLLMLLELDTVVGKGFKRLNESHLEFEHVFAGTGRIKFAKCGPGLCILHAQGKHLDT